MTRRLVLDFANPLARPQAPGLVLLALGMIAVGVAVVRLSMLQSKIEVLSAQVAMSAGATDNATPSAAGTMDPTMLARGLAQAQVVRASLDLPWPGLFQGIESASVPNVTLVAVQPEGGNSRRIRITGAGLKLEDALTYVAKLGATPGFADTHLVAHESVVSESERRSVRFTLSTEWSGRP